MGMREGGLLFIRKRLVLFNRVYDQEFGDLLTVLADQVPVFYFQVAFELAEVPGLLDHACFELDSFDQVISQIHH